MPAYKKTAPSASHVVTEDRFKILPVTSKCSIRNFVAANGVTFAPGRGFYQLTKPETIQAYKEIVAVRISDGCQVSGDAVRELLKIPSGEAKFKYTQVPDFEVFVQSTSYNRVLMPDTKFLYEVNPSARGSPGKSGSGAVRVAHSEKRTVAAPPPTVPGCPIDLVFSFDTTGSMYYCLEEVRKNLEQMIERILTDIPNIRIAVFAQGDYCDYEIYVTKFIDFTTDKAKLVKFVKEVEGTGGDDFEECYELVLQEARTKLSWAPGSQRAMVMIGDAIPHSVNDYKTICKKYHAQALVPIDWRQEADELVKIGCRVYAVQCNPSGPFNGQSAAFFQGLSFKTYGHHLTMSNFSNVLDFIMAIAYREQGAEQLEAYRQEVIKRTPGGGDLNSDLHSLFDNLAGGDVTDTPGPSADSPVVTTMTDLIPPTARGKKRAAPKTSAVVTKKAKSTVVKPAAKKRKASAAVGASPAKKAKASTTVKKTPAKKTPAKKTPARKTPANKSPAKKTPAKKSPAEKTPAKKTSAKKTPAKKSPAKKAPVKKSPAKKTSAKKAPMKKSPAKKTSAKKAPVKKTPAKKTPAKKTPARKTPTKKTPVTKTPLKTAPAKKASAKKAGSKK